MDLKRWRRLNDMSLAKFSKKTGGVISASALCSYENGKKQPRPEYISIIKDITGGMVTADDLHQKWSEENSKRLAKKNAKPLKRKARK